LLRIYKTFVFEQSEKTKAMNDNEYAFYLKTENKKSVKASKKFKLNHNTKENF